MKPRISCVRYWGARWVFCLDKRNGSGDTMRVEMFDMFRNSEFKIQNSNTQHFTIDMSAVPSGVYVLRVTLTDGAVRTTKVVKR